MTSPNDPTVQMAAPQPAPPSDRKSGRAGLRKKLAVAAAAVLVAGAAGYGIFKYARNNIIPFQDAVKHIGRTKTVEGTVMFTNKIDAGAFLNFGGGNTSFVAMIPSGSFGNFPGGFEQLYEYKKIRVTGGIESYKGKPEIKVQHPSQIEIVGNASQEFLPSQKNLIPYQDATKYLYQIKTVEGVIEQGIKSERDIGIFFHFEPGNRKALRLICFQTYWGNFPPFMEALYVGKKVWVSGEIGEFRGEPQIYLNNPNQIRVLGEAPITYAPKPSKENLISYTDAQDFLGRAVTVEGRAHMVEGDKVTYLHFDDPSNASALRGAIFLADYPKFPAGFARLYDGKKVWVAGAVQAYRGGWPELVIQNPSQIKIVP